MGYSSLIRLFAGHGFGRVERISQRQEYFVKGDIISFWPSYSIYPIRIEFFGEDIESAKTYDITVNKTISNVEYLLIANEALLEGDKHTIDIINIDKKYGYKILNFEQFKDSGINFNLKQPTLFFNRVDLLENYIKNYKNDNFQIKIHTKHIEKIPKGLSKYLTKEEFPAGIISDELKEIILTDREMFGTIFVSNEINKNKASSSSRKLLSQFEGEIEIGEFVVHEDHGIGIYEGIVKEKASTEQTSHNNYIKIAYKDDDELLVPLNMIYKITKYFGDSDTPPEVTSLGKTDWKKLTKKVGASIQIMASELVRHYANISLSKAEVIKHNKSKSYQQFSDDFEYIETPDQKRSIDEIIIDLENDRPMNRLLVGDVGFGKTEVIMRAAFKVVESGKQVAILAPTTVLVKQHERNFISRFKKYKFTVKTLSRVNNRYQNKDILDNVSKGNIDILIGTHRLLSNDIGFKDLGLLVIDEEQKFGVAQKEKLKKLKYGVHVLSTSATPIPRTLSMALSTIQDISIIQTAPPGRKPVKTYVEKIDWNKITDAITTEIKRGGQVFFVYNRVSDINSIANKLRGLIPGIRIAVGHGQMSGDRLDTIMSNFIEHEYDVLLSTTIIENGIDMSNVNTLIVIKSQNFGLSQLYQLRGRVGRSKRQAFAYFFYDGINLDIMEKKGLTGSEKKLTQKKYLRRLNALKAADKLGAGFNLATKDLEIRGAGNLLGKQQHGNISKIGYGLYMQMLADEIERLKASENQMAN